MQNISMNGYQSLSIIDKSVNIPFYIYTEWSVSLGLIDPLGFQFGNLSNHITASPVTDKSIYAQKHSSLWVLVVMYGIVFGEPVCRKALFNICHMLILPSLEHPSSTGST